MLDATIIPKYHGARLPADSTLDVCRVGDMIVEQLKQRLTLTPIEPNDPANEANVDVQRLTAGVWMDANNRVNR